LSWLLLLLLADLLRKLLDFLALLGTVAPGVMHQALCTTVVAAGRLTGALVTTWTIAPTCHYSGGCPGQRLVLVDGLLHLLLATALSSDICVGLAGLPCF
jgi:hypothetical protein